MGTAKSKQEREIGTPRAVESGEGGPAIAMLPVNREDALTLLAGLGWPDCPPGHYVALPILDRRLATVVDGMRRTEEEALAAGLSGRFPILVEIQMAPSDGTVQYVGWPSIARLVFRSDEERDAFRYRPVAEFDPSDISCVVDPTRFGHEGGARFETVTEARQVGAAQVADKLGGAIAVVGYLVGRRPRLFDAASVILGARPNEEPYRDLLGHCLKYFNGASKNPLPDEFGSIVETFLKAGEARGRGLVQSIFDRLTDVEAGRDVGAVEARWFDRAMDLFDNAYELSGREFTDDKRLDLRAALLAAHSGRIDAIDAALDLPTPAGSTVVLLAGFLMGLSIGLRGLDWDVKRPALLALSAVVAACYQSLISKASSNVGFTVRTTNQSILSFGDDALVSIPIGNAPRSATQGADLAVHTEIRKKRPRETDVLEEEAIRLGLQLPLLHGAASFEGWQDVLLPDGKEAVAKVLVNEGRPAALTLRRLLTPPSSAAKATALLAANIEPGIGWRLAMEGKSRYAVIDFPIGTEAKYLDAVWGALAAIELRFVRVPAPKRKRAKARRVKTIAPG